MARGRERSEAALALPELRADAGLVGECAGSELAGAAGTLQDVRSLDWVAVSVGGIADWIFLGCRGLALHLNNHFRASLNKSALGRSRSRTGHNVVCMDRRRSCHP